MKNNASDRNNYENDDDDVSDSRQCRRIYDPSNVDQSNNHSNISAAYYYLDIAAFVLLLFAVINVIAGP